MDIIQTLPFTFYETVFKMYYCSDGKFYLPLNDICDAVGLDASGQRQRILRDDAINDALITMDVDTPYGDDGATRMTKTSLLWLNRLPYWLGSVDSSRVKPEIKDRLITYKRELADAAWAVFRSDLVPGDRLP